MLKSSLPWKFSLSIFLLVITGPSIGNQRNQSVVAMENAHQQKVNKDMTRFVQHYIRTNNESLLAIKQRSNAYFHMMDGILKKYGLPSDLKYLAVVESELKTTAVSKVGAVGPWQLMPETAQLLGLKVDETTDERKQYYKSTRAAAMYLKDLHAEFGDWLLVLAAYNAGPGPVHRAMRLSHSQDFWKLQYYLPAETRAHVKKIIATHYYFEGYNSATTSAFAKGMIVENAGKIEIAKL